MQNVHCCKTKTLLLMKKQNLQKVNSRPCNLLSIKETEKKQITNFILIFCHLDSQWKVNVHMTLWYINLNLNSTFLHSWHLLSISLGFVKSSLISTLLLSAIATILLHTTTSTILLGGLKTMRTRYINQSHKNYSQGRLHLSYYNKIYLKLAVVKNCLVEI